MGESGRGQHDDDEADDGMGTSEFKDAEAIDQAYEAIHQALQSTGTPHNRMLSMLITKLLVITSQSLSEPISFLLSLTLVLTLILTLVLTLLLQHTFFTIGNRII